MTPNGSDFSDVADKLKEAFQTYYKNNSTYSYMTADIMKVDDDTGDIAIDVVKIVVLNPVAFDSLHKLLPLLHEPTARAILADVMEETVERLEEEDESRESPEED